ncbi:MAG: AAA family ATPase [Paludibacteraceae bacterium]|nr:AAA family ATPase [Paludibacteraceae bacterium]
MRNIYIVGYMASGKTTLGKRLAEDLCLDFIDSDDYIEKSAGKTIAEIFIQDGEDYFREQERNFLSILSTVKNTVIATGGGLPCHSDNMKFLNSVGETVFVNTPIDTIMSRLKAERETRPLVKGLNSKILPYFVKEHYAKRLPIYMQAKHIISTEDDYAKLKDYLFELD